MQAFFPSSHFWPALQTLSQERADCYAVAGNAEVLPGLLHDAEQRVHLVVTSRRGRESRGGQPSNKAPGPSNFASGAARRAKLDYLRALAPPPGAGHFSCQCYGARGVIIFARRPVPSLEGAKRFQHLLTTPSEKREAPSLEGG
ncbi:unnamed protein product [Prorocentrum cordatum]|uniref:Uncharacterized protein n=1 Tax=Prorocentrum cordatum TaxID=2364126 RepID=A0ABN9TTH2_9DINO|nr:unnamed protein product [Polarella glacialis]